MRAAAFFILWILLPLCVGAAQANVTTPTGPKSAVEFPVTGIAPADLEMTLQHLEKLLPAKARVLYIFFLSSDSALVTLRIGRDTSVRDFDLRRVNGAWKKSEEREARPANYPSNGIAVVELKKALSENEGVLPTKEGILEFRVEAPTTFSVWTGIRYGPRSGSGKVFEFNKLHGKWQKAAGEGEWKS